MHHVGRVARKVTFAQCNNPVSAIAQSNKCTRKKRQNPAFIKDAKTK